MYKLENYKIKNAEPWNISFEERIGILTDSSGCDKIIYIYERADTSTFRYRAYNMCQSLNFSKKYTGTYFFEEELENVEGYLDKIKLVIIVRTRWSLKLDNFISKTKKAGIGILFDVDDIVFDLKTLPLLMNTSNVDFNNPVNYEYWFSYVGRIWLTGSACDGFICTNEFLRKNILKVFNKPTFVINNFLNHEQIELSARLFEEKTRLKSESPFAIGYFSGSPSHTNDFGKIAPEIEELLKKYKDIVLDIVGFMDIPDYLTGFLSKKRIIHSKLVDFLTLQKKMAEVDVNVVPLINNKFTNCKSELKYFESAIVGTVTCATPTYVFEKNIQNGLTGFLCEEGEWYSTVEKIYKKETDSSIISRANEYCLDKYSPKKQVLNIEKVFDSAISGF